MPVWSQVPSDTNAPHKLHDAAEFNDTVGIDGFFWTGRAGFQVMVFHCIDEASLFHLGRRLENRNLEHVIPALSDMWLSWAGSPANVYSDPAGEFVSDQWLSFLQNHSISPKTVHGVMAERQGGTTWCISERDAQKVRYGEDYSIGSRV